MPDWLGQEQQTQLGQEQEKEQGQEQENERSLRLMASVVMTGSG
jgi:hypothetical protein